VSWRIPPGPNPRNDPDCDHDTRFKPDSSVTSTGMTVHGNGPSTKCRQVLPRGDANGSRK
jgi:hypothetical protein